MRQQADVSLAIPRHSCLQEGAAWLRCVVSLLGPLLLLLKLRLKHLHPSGEKIFPAPTRGSDSMGKPGPVGSREGVETSARAQVLHAFRSRRHPG